VETIQVRKVLGKLRGEGGAVYVPAFEVEHGAQFGAKRANPLDPMNYLLGSSSSGFSTNRATTLPVIPPGLTTTVPWLGQIPLMPSIVPGGSRSFSRYEGSSAAADKIPVHNKGLAYFSVPAATADVLTGSHWEVTLRDADGQVIPLNDTLPGFTAPSSGEIRSFRDGAEPAFGD
jgi:hypothetical protein